ncbi:MULTISPECIES: hypothetical protein [Xanthomonas]|uniref:hypothetical protein n=1 Tax=Xanthomonas TaxID=338 RepID=UPI0011C42542|nr:MULTISPECIES: hypothetical protein [Xanthomonas]CAD1789475.1 hypothetical protein XSP_001297 [Xanthomonas sp. CPBF 426]CAG2086902.1 hypothetical protein XCY_001261 [Xanthomonas euroxanthea]
MNQTRAKNYLHRYGICLSRQDDRKSKEWLTTPANNPEKRLSFPTILAAIEYWDCQARWLAFDTALAAAALEHAKSLGIADRIAFDECIDGADAPMPEAMMNSSMRATFPKDWRNLVQAWTAREGSIAQIDIFRTLKHARSEQQNPSPPRERETKNEHRMAERRDCLKGGASG